MNDYTKKYNYLFFTVVFQLYFQFKMLTVLYLFYSRVGFIK